ALAELAEHLRLTLAQERGLDDRGHLVPERREEADVLSLAPGSALSAVQRAEDLGADPHRDDDLLDRLARRVRRELSGRALRQHRSDDSLSGGERGAARVPDVAVNARGDEPVVLGHEDRERLEPEVRGE